MLTRYLGEILFHTPEKSGLPSGSLGRRRSEIRLAVGQPRNPRGRIIQPLGKRGRSYQEG